MTRSSLLQRLEPDGTVTRAEVLDLLAGLAEKVGSSEWRRGEFAGFERGDGLCYVLVSNHEFRNIVPIAD